MNIFLRILLSGRKYWFRLIIAFIAMLFAGSLAIWPTWTLKLVADILASGQLMSEQVSVNVIPKQLVDYGIEPVMLTIKPSQVLNWVPFLLLGLFSLNGILQFFQVFNTRYFGVLVTNNLREQAHSKLMNFSLSQIRRRSSGDFVSCLTNDLTLAQSLIAEAIMALVTDSVSAIALGLWLLIIDWKLSLIGIVVLPGFVLFLTSVSKKLRRQASKGQEFTAVLSSFVSETVQGIDLLHLFDMHKIRQRKFEEASAEYVKIWRKQFMTDASISPMLATISALVIGFIIWFGLRRVLAGNLTIGDFSSYLVSLILLYQPIKRLARVNSQVNQISGNCQRVFALLDMPIEIENSSSKRISKESLNINFKNVNFHYLDGQSVLKDINLNIEEGSQISIVGSSGSGKSTLIALVPRLYDIQSGDIQVSGLSVKDWDLSELRRLIAFVPQDPFLFSGSLRDNLLLVKPEASDREIEKALELAKVDFLDLIQGGLDGKVGERGVGLSGGQRQRIGIARAFLKDSPLLILDEPTSSLDQQSEELIKQSLKILMKDRTVILVTHKLSTAKDFSRIICMKDGRIVEEGSHDELIQRKNCYYQLINTNQ